MLLLKAFWPYILGAALVIGFGLYIGTLKLEISHYKSQLAQTKAEYEAYKLEAEHQAKALEQNNAAINLKHKEVLNYAFSELDKINKDIKERIRGDKTARGISLPSSIVGLFNESAGQGNTTTKTDPGNAGKAGSTKDTGPLVTEDSYNLGDLLFTADENNKNHWKCIKQVEEWQSFWHDFEVGVAGVVKSVTQ